MDTDCGDRGRCQRVHSYPTTDADRVVFAGATGFIEELGFRGYIFQNLGSRFPLWLATLVTGVVFGLLHFGEIRSGSAIFLVQAVLITTLFVLCRLRSGALWLAIGVHAGWNWMEDSIFGFASTDTHALLHLKFLQPIAVVFPEFGFVGVLMELLGIGSLVWLPRRKTWRLAWQACLNEEGRYQARGSPAQAN